MGLNLKRRNTFLARLMLACTLVLFSFTVEAATSAGLTYQGRILKPSGQPLEASSVEFQIQLRTPNSSNCLLYQETKRVDMTGSNGAFSLTINDGTGDTLVGSYSLDDTFSNRKPFNVTHPNLPCVTTGVYNPSPADGRKMVVYFKETGAADWERLSPMDVNFVPQALEAVRVGGFAPANLLRVDDSAMTANADPLTSTQFTDFMDLINGTSTKYTRQSAATGTVLSSSSSTPAGATPGSIWYDPTDQKLKFNDGTATPKVLGSSGSGGTLAGNAVSILDSTNTNSVQLRTPAVADGFTGSYTLTLPVNDGNADDLLSTNGSGVLSWVSGSSLGAWAVASGNATRATGRVGIGTASPTSRLHIAAESGEEPLRISRSSNAGESSSIAFAPAGGLTSSNPVWSMGMEYGSADFGIRTYDGTTATRRVHIGANGNIGVGTDSSTYKLLVNGTIRANEPMSTLQYNVNVHNPAGTKSSAYSLTANNTANITGSTNHFALSSRSGAGVDQYSYFGTVSTGSGYTPNTVIGQATSATDYVERMRIDSTGNVGINSTNPKAKLDVNGDVAMRTTLAVTPVAYSTGTVSQSGTTVTGTGVSFGTNMIGYQLVYADGTFGGTVTNILSGTSLTVNTSQTVANQAYKLNYTGLQVASTGRVGVNVANPLASLHVGAGSLLLDGNSPAFYIRSTSYPAVGSEIATLNFVSQASSTSSSFYPTQAAIGFVATETHSAVTGLGTAMAFSTTQTGTSIRAERMRLDHNGRLGIGNTSPQEKLDVTGNIRAVSDYTCTMGNASGSVTCSSDGRLKENVLPIEAALDKILQLRGVEFDWNEKSRAHGRHDIGVIAQEVEKVFPTLVKTNPDTGYKMVDYGSLVSPLIQAMKEFYKEFSEQKEQNEKTEREVERLSKEVADLKAYICAKDPAAAVCK